MAQLYPQALLGYRIWEVSGYDQHVSLNALREGEEWLPEGNLARCQKRPSSHQAPVEHCHCGLYAFYQLWRARNKARFHSGYKRPVVGAVLGTGEAQCHYTGFRAEKARVLALLDTRHPRTQDLSERYQVPVFKREQELSEYCRQYGDAPPKSARPKRPRFYRNQDCAAALAILGGFVIIWNIAFALSVLFTHSSSETTSMIEAMAPLFGLLMVTSAAGILIASDS